MGRFNFVSPGAAAGAALRDFLVQQEAKKRQAMQDQLLLDREARLAESTDAQIANTKANTESLIEQRKHNATLADQQAAGRAADARLKQNQLGVQQMIGDAMQQGPLDKTRAQQIAGMAYGEGLEVPGIVSDALKNPAAQKKYEVTVPGPNGKPMKKLVSDEELAAGVEEYERKPQASTIHLANGMTPTSEANFVMSMQRSWDKTRSSEKEMTRQMNIMQSALARFPTDPVGGSEGVRVTFEKILDPISVVREGEYARQGQGLSLLNKLEGLQQRYLTGGGPVPESALREMVVTAQAFMDGLKDFNTKERQRMAATADRYQIPHSVVFGPETPSAGGSDNSGAPGGKVITQAQIQAIAAKKGLTPAAVAAQAQQQGYTVK